MITSHQTSDKDAEYQWRSQYEGYDAARMETFSSLETAAGGVLLDYVRSQFLGRLPRLRLPLQRQDDEFMMIDKNSLKALEIRETLRDGAFEGSLLQTVRRTVTKSGTRLLSRRLSM
jgi:DNA mismatch repair ATPase MutS